MTFQPRTAAVTSFEFPLVERTRTLLRLEQVYQRLVFFIEQDETYSHHAALMALFEVLEAAGRTELKSDLLQELERSLSFWRSQLDWKLGCEPVQFVANEATPVNAEGAATQNSNAAMFAVAAGSRVGVRVGDIHHGQFISPDGFGIILRSAVADVHCAFGGQDIS